MRVAVVSNITAPYRVELFEHVAREHQALKVYFQEFRESDRSWERFPELPYPHEYLSGRGLQWGNRYIGLYTDLGRRLKREAPDVVVCYGFSTATLACSWYCAREGKRLIIANDGTCETDPGRGMEAAYRKWLVSQGAAFIAASGAAAEYFVALGAEPHRVTVIPLTTDLHALAREVARRRQIGANGPLVDGPVVCFPTRLVPGKRVAEACKAILIAAETCPQIRFRIAGDGPLGGVLAKWVETNGAGKIDMLGMLSWEQMLDLYATSDLLLFTGTRERFGMVILEALAAGLPVVSYAGAGAARELVTHGVNGYLVDEGDTAGLAAGILNALEGAQYEYLSQNAQSAVQKYDIRVAARQFAGVVKSLVDKPVQQEPAWIAGA